MRPGPALPKLIATDLDGTLLRSDRSVSERTCAALKACAAAGIEVVLVTARPHRTVVDLAQRLGSVTTAICANGAAVLDVASAAAELVHSFQVEQALGIVAELRPVFSPRTGFALETGGQVFCEPEFRPGLISGDGAVVTEDLRLAQPVGDRYVKVLARDDLANADDMVAAARAVVGDRAEPSQSGGRGLVEIAPRGATKAGTLAWHCARLGIGAHDVVAFGDMPNDLPMLTWAGTAYAVANAHADVLAVVDRVTASNDEDGVAAALEALLGLETAQNE
ncbi:MAG TPA: HAD family hydrolase [Actinocrinis sp.]|nr:HAD family hydrolase [Actinocrinis sp.]